MDLLGLIETNKDIIRKLFGERELKIIEKQLLGVKLTQSEKNRLSRDIRIKLEAVKELSKYQDEFKLKKGTKNKKLVKAVLEAIKNSELFPKIKRIILFGSAAENELTLLSDIDIAVDFDKISKEESLRFCIDIKRNFSDRLDIQVYNVLPYKIKAEIDKYGKILYLKE
jgi:predicted nucleotidyltransferase